MNDIDPVHIQNLIDLRLSKLGKNFLTLNQMLTTKAILKALHLKTKIPNQEVLAYIEPHLGERFQIYKTSKGIYLGRKQADSDLVFEFVSARPGTQTLKYLAIRLPLPMATLMAVVNSMLSAGQLSIQFTKPDSVRLFPGIISAKPPPCETMQDGDANSFRAAYDKVRGGNEAVRIHKLREYLGWAKARFDEVIAKLRAEYKIDLHLGDASRLSRLEVNNSYQDPHGTLYISLTWGE